MYHYLNVFFSDDLIKNGAKSLLTKFPINEEIIIEHKNRSPQKEKINDILINDNKYGLSHSPMSLPKETPHPD